MGLIAKDNSIEFELISAGTFPVTCIHVIGLGVQQVTYQGTIKTKNQVRLTFELTTELMKDNRPFVIGGTYTLSLSPQAKLCQHLESWRGRKFTEQELEGFNLFNILGKPCLITVIHDKNESDGNTYSNISTISKVPKGMIINNPINPLVAFDPNDIDQQALDKLPKWIQNKINYPAKEEFSNDDSTDTLNDPFIYNDSEIPF